MRVVLVTPSRRDPAHRRVADALRRELEKAGDRVTLAVGPSASLARADVCHVQFFSRGLGWLAGVALPPGVKLVLTHQGASLELLEHPAVFDALARRADAVTCVSMEAARELERRLPGLQVRVIPNGTAPAAPARKTRRPPFILAVSRLAAYKGLDILLLAYAGLDARDRPPLVLCGPDQTRGRLAGFVRRLGLAKEVRLLGEADFKTTARLLRDCLFFALPSRSENMPMALLEAMAAGKAVVASKVGGVPEAVTDGKTGLLVAPKNVKALTRALRRLVSDSRLRRRLGAAAKARARDFRWSAIARKYRALYA